MQSTPLLLAAPLFFMVVAAALAVVMAVAVAVTVAVAVAVALNFRCFSMPLDRRIFDDS